MLVAAAQFASVWLDTKATTAKVVSILEKAHEAGVELVAFPESFLPGYPFWVLLGGGGRLGDAQYAAAYAQYLEAAVELEGPELAEIARAAAELKVHVLLGITERGSGPGSGSLFCTLVAIDPDRRIVGAHRKLNPTHTERTVWARGDGYGLRTNQVGRFKVGGLSCWENWMPLARHALYAAGEDVHIATWPGSAAQNRDLPRFIALEGRVYVVLASGLISQDNVPTDFPFHSIIRDKPPGFFNGGSSITGPDGQFVVEPVIDEEKLLMAEIDVARVHAARHTMDPTGHYSRPDVFELRVDRRRQLAAQFLDPTADG